MSSPTVLAAPSFGVAHVTLDAVIISCDEVYASLIGTSKEDAVGRRISDFTLDSGAGGPEMMIGIIVRTGEPMAIRRTFVRPDGTRVACAFQLCLIRDASGHPHSVVAVGQVLPATAL